MGKESRCAAEVKDLFEEVGRGVLSICLTYVADEVLQYAERLYSTGVAADGDGEESENHDGDIEGEIKAEIDGLQKPASAPLFIHVKLDVQCGRYTDAWSCVHLIDGSQSCSSRRSIQLSPPLSSMQFAMMPLRIRPESGQDF